MTEAERFGQQFEFKRVRCHTGKYLRIDDDRDMERGDMEELGLIAPDIEAAEARVRKANAALETLGATLEDIHTAGGYEKDEMLAQASDAWAHDHNVGVVRQQDGKFFIVAWVIIQNINKEEFMMEIRGNRLMGWDGQHYLSYDKS